MIVARESHMSTAPRSLYSRLAFGQLRSELVFLHQSVVESDSERIMFLIFVSVFTLQWA